MRRLLLFALENRPRCVARLRHPRPVDLRLRLGLMSRRSRVVSAPALQDVRAHTLGFIRLDRARMRLLLGNSDCRECVQDFLTFDFQLTR
jgi:hypothetical protein